MTVYHKTDGKSVLLPLVLLPLVFLVALPLPALAGGSEKVLGAPSYDHATETTYRAITWADFKGREGQRPPGWSRWQQGSFAHIATGLHLSKYQFREREQNGEWIATAVGARSYAIMNKDLSAVRHGSRNAYTLDHEQLHFDLAEAAARRLTVELAAIEGHGALRQDARADLARRIGERFDSGLQELGELQNRYDNETEHGLKKKKQKKWAAAVPEMFRQATEALVTLLEERSPAH